MRVVTAAEVEQALDDRELVDCLHDMFRDGCTVPLRHHHDIDLPHGSGATLLLMPAWRSGEAIGIKSVTVFPDNPRQNSLPSIMGVYLLLDGDTGAPKALIDGMQLTLHRTACASALAADFLARRDARRLLMVGAGALAPHLIRAHAAVRPIREVLIWNHNADKAEALAGRMKIEGLSIAATADLEGAVAGADIVSAATLSPTPLIHGAWLTPGTHVDLVGAFRPDMRESDDEAVRRARLFVDTMEGGLNEAGDIVMPLKAGVIGRDDICGDLFALSRGDCLGRTQDDQITLFKSVGTALEDLAAAQLVMKRV